MPVVWRVQDGLPPPAPHRTQGFLTRSSTPLTRAAVALTNQQSRRLAVVGAWHPPMAAADFVYLCSHHASRVDALVRHGVAGIPTSRGRPGGSVRAHPLMGCTNVDRASPVGRCDPL
jgi:hypothetical protein